MKALTAIVTLVGLALFTHSLSAQEATAPSNTSPEHEFLKRFVGDWDVVSEGSGMKGEAIMNSSMMGDLWLVNSSEHKVGGTEMKSLQMIGYDPKKKKYVGIWADSMINHLWNYEGTLDDTGSKLTLDAEGPSMSGDGKMTNYRDAYEFKDDDTITATSSMQGPDGKWTVMMEGTAKRRK